MMRPRRLSFSPATIDGLVWTFHAAEWPNERPELALLDRQVEVAADDRGPAEGRVGLRDVPDLQVALPWFGFNKKKADIPSSGCRLESMLAPCRRNFTFAIAVPRIILRGTLPQVTPRCDCLEIDTAGW